MKAIVIVVALACLLSVGESRQLTQSFSALVDAAKTTRVSTFVSAVQAAGLTIPADAAWTIFAPTNDAFKADVASITGLTVPQLLEPGNKKALTKLLSYHVIPSGAVASTQLTNGQKLTTALKNAAPLTVAISGGKVKIDSANVVGADIKAGKSIIHVIDTILIPASLKKGASKSG